MKKRIAFLIIASIPLLGLIFYVNNIFNEIKQNNIDMRLKNEEALVYKLEAKTFEGFEHSKQDAIFMASYLGQNLAEAKIQNEAKANSDFQTIKDIMDVILPSFLNVNTFYSQISVLDNNGNEFLVANNKQVQIKSPENKSNEDYYRGVINHRPGEVYVSFDGSNVYISSPIYDETKFSGAVVLTLKKEVVLEQPQADPDEKIMLIDDTGKYISSSNFQAGNNFANDFSPQLLQSIKTSSTGHIETSQGNLLTFASFNLDNLKWFIITQVDKKDITANTSILYKQLLTMIGIVFVVVLGLLGLWSLSYRKAVQAKHLLRKNEELADLNSQLQSKQTNLEEQAAIVEELNAQLEDESGKYLRQKETLNAIIDSIGYGIAMIDTNDKAIIMNKTWRGIFNYDVNREGRTFIQDNLTEDSLIEKVVEGAINSQEVFEEIKALRNVHDHKYQAELEYKESKHRYCQISSVLCRASDGQALGRIFVFRDITHFKEIDLLKSELVSTVSHELRTPMSSIMGFSELLLTRQLSPERFRQYIEIIHEQAERLTKLISDFLDIQRMESGKQIFKKQRFDFIEIIHQAIGLNSSEGPNRIVKEWTEGESYYVLGDQDKLFEVMSNLLSNATKYSPQGGEITVRVSIDDGMLQVGISDHGLGIPEEALPKLFSKFFRVDNDDRRKIGGTGLGLAICKEIVQAHDGRIWAESIYGEGSTFYFTIPLAQQSSHQKYEMAKFQTSDESVPSDALLIVEDDVNLVNLIETVLNEEGFITYSVNSGEDALRLINQVDFKVIILDIKLAGRLTGWDVVKALKDNNRNSQVPVIISSIYENTVDTQEKGISDYLVKPFKPEQLLNVVRKVMNENVEANMLVHSDESIDEEIVNILRNNGIKVKGLKRTDSILMITLEDGR